jgi:DNA repair ATPase RecN
MNKTVDHWIAVADTLKQQRDQAEKERDEWKRKCLDEAGAHDKTRRAWGEEAADMTRNAMRDGSEFGSLLSERDALRAERDALRKEVERLTELAALSGEVFAFAITDSKLPNLETRRQLHDAVNRALTAAMWGDVMNDAQTAHTAVVEAAKKVVRAWAEYVYTIQTYGEGEAGVLRPIVQQEEEGLQTAVADLLAAEAQL